MPIIKLVFAEDIRRFALEKEATLETIEKLVGSTFNLSPNEFNLNYVDTDNDKVSISTDEELEEALQQVQGLPLKINVQKLPGKVQDGAGTTWNLLLNNVAKDFLRSSKSFTNEVNKPFQISPPNTPKPKLPVMEGNDVLYSFVNDIVPLQPEPIKPVVKPVSPLISMLSNRKTQDELTSLVFKTLQSPHFMDWVMNNDLLPGFFSVMAEVAKEDIENVVEKEIEKPQKAASEPILEPVKPLFNANNSVSIPEDKQTNPNQAEEKHVNEVENQPAEEQERMSDVDVNNLLEDGFVVVKKEPVIPGEEEEPEVEQKEPGLVQSLLSIFKKKEEGEVPNQEELLKKLADMGFTDKESNLKALRFHKKYNEGLDEVVEDLLLQRTTKAAEKDALQLSPIPLLPEINSKS